MRRLLRLVFALIVLAGSVLAMTAPMPAGAIHAPSDPPYSVPVEQLAAGFFCDGALDGPKEPVLLVHGTFTNYQENYGMSFGQQLPVDGFDICHVNLPNRSLDDIQEAAEFVVYAVRAMSAASGLKVDIVGHSQGVIEPRWALRWWPSLRGQVDDMVGMAGPNHGTAVADIGAGERCEACWQLSTQSQFMAALNSLDESPGGVSYTSLFSSTDELVQPAPPLPGAVAPIDGATNIWMQQSDVCPLRPVEHAQFAFDKVVYDLVTDAFENPGGTVPVRAKDGQTDIQFCAQMGVGTPVGPDTITTLEGFLDPRNSAQLRSVPAEPPLKCYVTDSCGSGAGAGDGDGEVVASSVPATPVTGATLPLTGARLFALALGLACVANGAALMLLARSRRAPS